MFPAQDLRVGGRQSKSQYQFTLWSADLDELFKWVPRVTDRIKQVDGVVDVSTDREQGGLQLGVIVDRPRASRLGVKMQAIDCALNNAFAQRQISTIYTAAQPVSRHSRDRSAIPARPERPRRISTCRAAAARRFRCPTVAKVRAGAGAARRQPSGPVSGGDDLVRAAAGHRRSRPRPQAVDAGDRRTAHAGFDPRRVRRRRARLRAECRLADRC